MGDSNQTQLPAAIRSSEISPHSHPHNPGSSSGDSGKKNPDPAPSPQPGKDGYAGSKEAIESVTYNALGGQSAKRIQNLLQRIKSEFFVFGG